ncbi:hypothetical protein PBI_SCTP2_244 [Salicola phage SCTP-2]|nr:hypothetical protein PBI_SCTP2_244 [Salicola phage SCTP-2]
MSVKAEKAVKNMNEHTIMINNTLYIPNSEIVDRNHKKAATPRAVMQLVAELANYGFLVDEHLKNTLFCTKHSYLVQNRDIILNTAKSAKGDNVSLIPLFDKFPSSTPKNDEYYLLRIISKFEELFGIQTTDRVKLSCGCSVNKNYFEINTFNKCPVCQCHAEELYTESSNSQAIESLDKNDMPEPFRLTHCDEDDLYGMIESIVTSTTSVTKSSKLFFIDYIADCNSSALKELCSKSIYFKDTLSIIAYFVVNSRDFDNKEKVSLLDNNVTSANDIFRIAHTVNNHESYTSQFKSEKKNIDIDNNSFYMVTENNDHINKKYPFKFTNTSRKVLMGLLDTIKNPYEDMKSNREQWLRMAEQIHPTSADMKKRYSKAAYAFKVLRNDEKTIKSFNAMIDGYFEQLKTETDDISNVISIAEKAFCETFTKRPGVMVRNMDRILRETDAAMKRVPNNDNSTDLIGLILDSLKGHYQDLDFRGVISARDHFAKRMEGGEDYRIFSPAKSSRKFVKESELEILDHDICKRAIECFEDIIYLKLRDNKEHDPIEQYFDGDSHTGIYIDPALYKEKMPIYLRTEKESLYVMETYSSIDIDSNYDVVRAFTYWDENKDAQGEDKEKSNNTFFDSNRVDIDLSMKLFSSNSTRVGDVCSYMDLIGKIVDMIHSGDIQQGPGAEFIDININSAIRNDCQYGIGFINSYTGQAFDNYYCFAGLMFRKYTDTNNSSKREAKGKRFDINTVHHKFDITGGYNSTIPYILDFKNRKMIIVNFNQSLKMFSNVETNESNERLFLNHALINERNNMSIGKYMELFLKAKGYEVSNEEADNTLTIDKTLVGHVNQFSQTWMS